MKPIRALGTGMLARNAGLNLMGFGLPVLVALMTLPVLARELEPARFGLLGIAWLLLGYANELGFGRATTKYVAEAVERGDDARFAGVAWATILLQLVFGVLVGALLAVATPSLIDRVLRIPPELVIESTTSLYLLAASVPLIVAAAALRGVLEAFQRFDLVNLVRAPVTAANFLLPLIGLLAGMDIGGIVLLLVASRAASLVAYLALGLRVAPALRGSGKPSATDFGTVLAFGGWTTISGVISPLLIYLDRFLLGALVSLAAVAYYTAPYEVVARLLIVPAAVVGTLFPAFSTLHGRGDLAEAARIAARAVKYTLLAVGPIAILLIAIAPDVLSLWLGVTFASEGALALQLLAAGMVINAAAHVPLSLLHGIGRAELPGRFHLVELPIHFVVAVVLIRSFGVPGAALAWCLRATLDATLLFAATARTTPLTARLLAHQRVPWTAAILLGFSVAGGLTALILPIPPLRLAAALLVTAISLTTLWRYSMQHAERAWLLRILTPVRASQHL